MDISEGVNKVMGGFLKFPKPQRNPRCLYCFLAWLDISRELSFPALWKSMSFLSQPVTVYKAYTLRIQQMCFCDDWSLLFQSLCPSFPLLREPAQNKCCSMRPSSWRLCQQQERLSFHQPKIRISSCFDSELQQKMVCFMVASQNLKAIKFLSIGRTCLRACWTSTTKPGRSTHLNLDSRMQAPTSKLSFHLLGILHSEAAVLSFLGWVILSLCQMLSVTNLKELLRPLASLSLSQEELHKQSTAILACGYHHSAPQTS